MLMTISWFSLFPNFADVKFESFRFPYPQKQDDVILIACDSQGYNTNRI